MRLKALDGQVAFAGAGEFTFEAVDVDTWEYMKGWKDEQMNTGTGDATFERVRG